MLTEFVEIFTNMSQLAAIFFIAGLFLMVLEIIIPTFSVLNFTGVICVIGGIITRSIQGVTFFQVAMMVLLALLVCGGLIAVYINMLDKKKNALVQSDVTISEEYKNPKLEYGHLLYQTGYITAACKPYGKANIEGQVFEVISNDGKYIVRGQDVRVVDVDFDHIFVEVIKEESK